MTTVIQTPRDHIVVNAGGRRFETTSGTLRFSGSKFFQALLGPTGTRLAASASTDVENKQSSNGKSIRKNDSRSETPYPNATMTQHTGPFHDVGQVHPKTDRAIFPSTTTWVCHDFPPLFDSSGGTNYTHQSNSAMPQKQHELFLDRDPALFAMVLSFMRSNRLPASIRRDELALEDLQVEAEFLAFDGLHCACQDALDALSKKEQVRERRQHHQDFPTAKSGMVWVPCKSYGETRVEDAVSIPVPMGQILYIVEAALTFLPCNVVMNNDNINEPIEAEGNLLPPPYPQLQDEDPRHNHLLWLLDDIPREPDHHLPLDVSQQQRQTVPNMQDGMHLFALLKASNADPTGGSTIGINNPSHTRFPLCFSTKPIIPYNRTDATAQGTSIAGVNATCNVCCNSKLPFSLSSPDDASEQISLVAERRCSVVEAPPSHSAHGASRSNIDAFQVYYWVGHPSAIPGL
jgi:hypothetical protein